MGPFFNKKRLQNSVQRTPNSVTRPDLLPAASKSAAGRGSRQSSLEGGSGGNNSGMSQILYSRIFLVPKKYGKLRLIIDLSLQNYFVYTETFKMETQRKVRNAIQLNDWAFSLDLTDAYLHIPIHYRSRKYLRFTLRGRVTSIRPLDKSFRVYTPYDCHSDIPKEKGDNSTSLSRRLVSSKLKPSKTIGTQTIHIVADQLTRSDHQLREIRPSSSPSVHFHRDGVSDSYQYRQSTSDQANEDIGLSQNSLTENLCISKRFPVPLGTTECCSRLCNPGMVTSPAITNVTAQSVETTEISVVSPDRYHHHHIRFRACFPLPRVGHDNENSATSQMVASGGSLSSRGSHEDRSSLPHHLYRCQPVRLGSSCGAGGTSVSWSMVAYIMHQGGTRSTDLSEEVWNILNLCLAHNM